MSHPNNFLMSSPSPLHFPLISLSYTPYLLDFSFSYCPQLLLVSSSETQRLRDTGIQMLTECQGQMAFRNEIMSRNFIFRSREFEQMEAEYFIPPGNDVWQDFHKKWMEEFKEYLWDLSVLLCTFLSDIQCIIDLSICNFFLILKHLRIM